MISQADTPNAYNNRKPSKKFTKANSRLSRFEQQKISIILQNKINSSVTQQNSVERSRQNTPEMLANQQNLHKQQMMLLQPLYQRKLLGADIFQKSKHASAQLYSEPPVAKKSSPAAHSACKHAPDAPRREQPATRSPALALHLCTGQFSLFCCCCFLLFP